MTKASDILGEARQKLESASTWADASNAVFDPIDGLIARAYRSLEDRRAFRGTPEYQSLQRLLEAAISKFGVINGAAPKKSGRFVVRLPRSLHSALDLEAKTEGVSLNQLVVAKLACQLEHLANDPKSAVIQAFLEVRRGFSTDRVVADPDLNRQFLNRCRELGGKGTDFDLNWELYNARKNGHLTNLPTKTKTFKIKNADEFEYASEIAVAYMKHREKVDWNREVSLDRIICDPDLATEFDRIADRLAPGFTPLEYRWIALGIRKAGRLVKTAAQLELPDFDTLGLARSIRLRLVPEEPGLYVFESQDRVAYVAQTENLRHRIEKHLEYSNDRGLPAWLYGDRSPRLNLRIACLPGLGVTTRRALELKAVEALTPVWNVARVA